VERSRRLARQKRANEGERRAVTGRRATHLCGRSQETSRVFESADGLTLELGVEDVETVREAIARQL
jgi:hypothetical protein